MGKQVGSVTARNTPLVISFFVHISDAELALADLMAEGLSEQDFTLVKFGANMDGEKHDALEDVIEPFGTKGNDEGYLTEGSSERESQIGGGIATSSPDDDVSSIQEMDDSESVAEATLYPESGHSISQEDTTDIERISNAGFLQASKPASTHTKYAETIIELVPIHGIGLVMGEGGFGERILEASIENGQEGVLQLFSQYNSVMTHPVISIFGRGAVLAVDVDVTAPIEERICDILRVRNARAIEILDPKLR